MGVFLEQDCVQGDWRQLVGLHFTVVLDAETISRSSCRSMPASRPQQAQTA
jgi:hypothetical protein